MYFPYTCPPQKKHWLPPRLALPYVTFPPHSFLWIVLAPKKAQPCAFSSRGGDGSPQPTSPQATPNDGSLLGLIPEKEVMPPQLQNFCTGSFVSWPASAFPG